MTLSPPNRRRLRAAAAAAVLLATAAGRASAADFDDSYLRGPVTEESGPSYVAWDGFYVGGQIGYSSMKVDLENSLTSESISVPNSTTNSKTYGGFFGYNWQIEPDLVLGMELNYTRPSSLSTSSSATGSTGNIGTSTYRLVDYATIRGRAGYAFGQFMPYAVFGAGAGRIDYSTSVVSAGGATIQQQSQDNAYTLALVAGLGMDVAVLPNVFVRGEWEFAYFTPVAGMAANVNSARVGLGIRF